MSAAKVILDTGERITITGVHPVADLFPMLDKEGLADLAASISERGLEHPVVIDNEDQVLDGRNRLACCQVVGVEPKAVRYDGSDPAGYALAVNLNRRFMNKGQQAMVAAQAGAFLKSTLRDMEEATGIPNGRLSYAKTVLDYAADLAPAVVSGARSLNDAYAEARKRKVAGDSEDARMAKLADVAPDLADLVIDETLTLAEAEARFTARDKDERERRERATKSIAESVVSLWARLDGDHPEQVLTDWLPEANPHANRQGIPDLFNTAGLRHVSGLVNRLADLVEKNGGQL